jgi:hypothetical protein
MVLGMDRNIWIVAGIVFFVITFTAAQFWYAWIQMYPEFNPLVKPIPPAVIEVYKDSELKVKISEETIEWDNFAPDTLYTQRIYVYNPMEYQQKLSIFWEIYPPEIANFTTYSSSLGNNTVVYPTQVLEVTLQVTMEFNEWMHDAEVLAKVLSEVIPNG